MGQQVRDERGRFVKNHPPTNEKNKGGRPPKRIERRFIQALRDGVGLDDWYAMMERLVMLATGRDKDGTKVRVAPRDSMRAIETLAAYDSGKPTQPVDVGLKRLPPDVKEVIHGEEE